MSAVIEPKLAVERLWKIYEGDKQRGEVVAIEDLSLAVYDNEFVSLGRPVGLRQVHAADDGGRAGADQRRRHSL